MRTRGVVLTAAWLTLVAGSAAPGGNAPFANWLAQIWPQAQGLGVSRSTFETATRGLEPDLSLPDLIIPGQPERPQPGQAEFVQTPADYLKQATLSRLVGQGRELMVKHRPTLSAIEQRFGVPATVVVAIWGRETGYGAARLPHNAVRALATQAYLGRRKDKFREEFLLALRMLQEGHVRLADMRSSWAGAMGHTQFLPSDFYRYAVDFDGDGRRDIWTSVPDALASAANQLLDKGWRTGQRWAHEVRVPKNVDCTMAEPNTKMPIGEWLKRGYAPAYNRKLAPGELAAEASLLLPAGTYGPGFLVPGNYFVLKDYNFSDLYVLFVGHLSDRLSDPRPFESPWVKVVQLKTAQVEAMQRRLTELGLYQDKIDGKAGMKTRSALGAYQKANGLALDCWPTAAVLTHMQRRVGAN